MREHHKLSLVANMGHTFRTPLNQILGYTEILQEQIAGELNERQLKHITSVSQAGALLLDVVNDLIDLAQIESGKTTVVLSTCLLDGLIQEIIDRERSRAAQRQLGLTGQFGNTNTVVEGDRQWLSRLFSILIGNAITAGESSSSIVVTAEPGSERDVVITIRVDRSDLAVPEAADDAHDIAMLASLYERECHGFGIRLALADSIARQHNGSLTIDTNGTHRALTISVTLPTAPGSQASSRQSVVEGAESS